MSEHSRFASGVLWSYIQAWVARGITTASFLIIGLFIGPHEFGLFSLVAALLMFTEMVCEQSLSQAVVQIEKLNEPQMNAAFFSALLAGVAISSGLFLGSEFLALCFKADSLTPLLKVSALCPLLIAVAAVPTGLLKRDLRFKCLAQRTFLASGLSSVIGIALVVLGFGALGLVVQAVFYYAISAGVLWKNCSWRPGARLPSLQEGAKVLRQSAANLSNKLLDFSETRGVEMLVGAVAGVQALGLFAFANKIAQTAFQVFSSPILDVIFSGVARNGRGEAEETLRFGQLVIATFPAAALFGLACAGPDLLSAVYGTRWQGAAYPLSVLCAAFLLRSFLYVFGTTLLALRASIPAVIIAAVRTSVAVGVAALALHSGLGAPGAAWGYLAGAVLVAPVSSFFIFKVTQMSLKTLLRIPLKVMLVAGLSAVLFLLLRKSGPDAPWFGLFCSALSTLVFLLGVMMLNAGVLAQSLRHAAVGERVSRLLRPVHVCAVRMLDLRERMRLCWFFGLIRFSVFCGKCLARKIARTKILIVPGDTMELSGSLGDQVLMLGLKSMIQWDCAVVVVDERCSSEHRFLKFRCLHAWSGILAGWKLGREAAACQSLFVIGADVMDGYYSPGVSRQRIMLANAFSRAGVSCSIMGFSFNERPHSDVIREFRCLPPDVRICLRDPVSLERFERIVGRSGVLVADLAFLAEEAGGADVARRVALWAESQRREDRKLLGVNVNPQVVAHLPCGTEEGIADSVAKCCKRLLGEKVSVVLIPHDFRPGCADLRVMEMVWRSLEQDADGHALLLSDPFSGQEIKSACRSLDLVLSARMHLAIGALSVSTPVCGIQYQGKFEGLFRHFNLGNDVFISPEDAMESVRLHAFIVGCLNRCDVLRKQVDDRLPEVRKLAALNRGEA
ncbi:oligosaccharide flippase family protein [Niveibacterium terrae]|uniref:oligosaccharide flippase family protein n=1 Tax=Niveibacterium terrae TaxID=3373598 RepID=UPI003A920847